VEERKALTRPVHSPSAKRLALFLLGPAALLLFLQAARAEDPAKVRISDIRIVRTGPARIFSDRQILSRMEIKKDRSYTVDDFRSIFNNDIKRLNKFGVLIARSAPETPQGDFMLTLWIEERMVVGKITFQGLDEFDDETVEKELGGILTVGAATDDGLIRYACERIRALYHAEGYLFAEVRYEAALLYDGRTHVIVRVFEGPQPDIDRILFRGNHSVGRGTLLDIMETGESGFFSSEPLDREKLRDDIKALEQFYREEGWRNARVGLEDIVFSESYEHLTVILHVEEGIQYRVGKVSLRGNTELCDREIRKVIEMKTGEVYRLAVFAGDMDRNEKGDAFRIKNLYGNRGYLFTRIVPEERFHPDSGTVDVTYVIHEGERVRLGQVIFRGNHKTRDDVLRRYLLITPGEYPRLSDIQDSFRMLVNTKYFSDLRPDWEDTEDPGVKNLVIDVEEAKMGDIRFILGYNTSSSLTGKVQLSLSNFDLSDPPTSLSDLLSGNAFVGGGQTLRIGFTIGMENQLVYQADFFEPYFFGTDTSLKVGAFKRQRAYPHYLQKHTEGLFEFGHRFGRYLYATAGYSLAYVGLSNISAFAAQDIVDSRGPSYISAVQLGLNLSNVKRDIGQPYEGASINLGYEYAGGFLQGDVSFSKVSIKFSLYETVFGSISGWRQILSLKLGMDWAEGHSGQGKLPIYERFFAGGLGSIRGFEYQGIGPRQNRDAVGGNFRATASLEYSVPIYRAPMVGMANIDIDVLRLVFFYDAATLAPNVEDYSTGLIRSSVGFGFRLRIPALGGIPISLDFGFPLARLPQDETQRVSFSLGFFFF
jgi:outer membrane protein assembly complex protein YaeT